MSCVSQDAYRNVIAAYEALGEPIGGSSSKQRGDMQSDNEDCAGPMLASTGHVLWPTAASECVSKELLNIYGTSDEGLRRRNVCDLLPGCGSLALAACRYGHRYIGLPLCDLRKAILNEFLLLAIAKELVEGTRAGFEMRLGFMEPDV